MVPVDDGLATRQVEERQRRVVAVLVEVVEPQHGQPETVGEVRLARPGGPGQDDHPRAHPGIVTGAPRCPDVIRRVAGSHDV